MGRDGQTQYVPLSCQMRTVDACLSLLVPVCFTLLKPEPVMPVETTQPGTPDEH
jgi:hypothetical protein